ncbi:hypothetical protein BUALT_Bualt09G0048600 [Buddleja alternifolia]|uniref:Major facilitator superfamily (MFS) profile domain-containing protein n=1 Tax=Buddleja alternifolia TaxID=168488 RepID=A0AAV6X786_9LAMI|nr:hypothetical protein BUALT_Bualt09G0048600 [Buddleja alternifolia]
MHTVMSFRRRKISPASPAKHRLIFLNCEQSNFSATFELEMKMCGKGKKKRQHLSLKMENQERRRHGYTMDEALSTLGFGNFQGFALFFAGIGWFTEAMEITLLSFIGPALKSEWSLSPSQESFLSSAVFGGMFLGALFWGFISDAYGRRMGLRAVSMATFGAGLLSAFSPDYKSLLILRFLLGFGAGGGHIIMPRLSWRWLLALSSLPSIMVLLFCSFVLESPRYLFMKGRSNEAIRVLEKVALINRKELPTDNLISDQQRIRINEENVPSEGTHLITSTEKQKSSFKTCLKPLVELFSSELYLITILVLFLNFVHTFAYYGLALMISALDSEQSDCQSLSTLSNNVKNDSMDSDLFITYLAELPGLIIGMILVDSLGRKLSMIILTMVTVIFMLPLLSRQTGIVTTSLLVSARMFLSAAFSILGVYGKEVYPTSVRASGSGFATSAGRIGGIICPLVAVGLQCLRLKKMGDEERRRHGDGYTIDEALSTLGFGNFHGMALFFAGIGWVTDAMELTLLSFIGAAVRSEWLLSPTQESLLSSSVFGGMFFGALFWGFISDVYGRRMGIRGVTITMFGAGLLSAFSQNYKSMIILRFFLGFGAGGTHVFSSWYLEFISSSARGARVLALSAFWTCGEILEASFAWIIMPRLGWRWLLALSSLPSLMVLLVSSFVLESPRYLFMKGQTNEAIRVLEKVALINRKELPTGNLISDQQRIRIEENVPSEETHPLLSSTEKQTSSFKTCLKPLLELFSSELYFITILVWFLNFVHLFAYYGLALMISTLNSGQSDCGSLSILSKNVDSDSMYSDVFITYLAELPGLMIAAIIVDRLGRKLSMITLTMVTVTFMLPLLSHQTGTMTTVLLIGARMFLSASFAILGVFGKEVYPTSVRASGSGFATSVGRIGGMICPLVAVGLVRGCHQTLAVIMFGILILLSGISVIFFPFETKGRGLTDVANASK